METGVHAIRVPLETIEKIKQENIDVGQLVYDVIEKGMNPYKSGVPNPGNNLPLKTILKKIIKVFVLEKVNAKKYEKEFQPDELQYISSVAREVVKEMSG